MKIVINRRFGGFDLSDEAHEWLIKNRNWTVTKYNKDGNYENPSAHLVLTDKPEFYDKYWDNFSKYNRTNQDVIDVVEELKEKANGRYAKLKIIEIPDDIKWELEEYDGMESIHEKHRVWN